jgi:hypothetical protein
MYNVQEISFYQWFLTEHTIRIRDGGESKLVLQRSEPASVMAEILRIIVTLKLQHFVLS